MHPPPFDIVVARLSALSPAAAADLARADQRDRWAAGDRVPAERYLAALPRVAENPDDALLVVYGEVLLRTELGETLVASSIENRFPRYRVALEPLFEVHRGLASGWVPTPAALEIADPFPVVLGYDRLRLAGRGAMGAVYQARDVRSGRPVAVKVVRTDIGAGPEELVRFLQEAEILVRLTHPNVVRFLASGTTDTGPYLVTEWVPHGSLADHLPEFPSRPDAVTAFALGVAAALGAAHAAGVVHRDVKPGNILLDASDDPGVPYSPKLTDFGLARLVGCGGTLTSTGEMLGTRRYMPPEQLEGRSGDVGPWSDLFSLGAVLYELLTHRPAFPERDTPAGLLGFTPPTPPRQLAPNVPQPLEQVCLRALEPDPADRYQTVAEFAAALGDT